MRLSPSLRIALILALCVSLVAPSAALALSAKDVAAHKAAAAAARKKAAAEQKKANELLSEAEKLEDRISAIQDELVKLGSEIGTAAQRRARLDSQIELLRSEIGAKEALIAQLKFDYDRRSAALAARVDAEYRTGDWAYIEMLLGSENLADLIQRTEYVTRIMQDDEAAAAELDDSRLKLEAANTEMARALETIQVKRAEARAEEQGLRDLQSARANKKAAEQTAKNEKTALLTITKKNVSRLRALAEAEEAESDRIAAELSGNGSGKFYGTMAWPVPASHRITSKFGWRICPFHGKEMHPGIDIGAPSGSSIVAAGSGRVIYAGWRGAYGNTVMIDHGNGVVTLYAHQRSGGIKVSNGERVSKGERIGTVGSTGNSTGPHLHFEIRVNGTPKNPGSYQ